jgi:hypothetical protein
MFFAFVAPIQDANRNQDNALRDAVNEHRRFVKDVSDNYISNRVHDDLIKRVERDEANVRQEFTDTKVLIANVSARVTNNENNVELRRLNAAILEELKATNHTIFEMLKPK